ncbi:MAG: DNA polymerase III subunit beta [Actinobacteria bacterium]|nr:DNA polymerase III subunit beta [Actinomycetota bacterium]MCZ6568234.1 DNA polymerase III subunit beta [Actinomycetota bacterium]MCZ6631162.1 DNA polymerase III subunit beta [Actinomycetota bacterium]MCZ6740013.1 DNA polymerase III subunit beta [Actinomycetota bacterium]
MRIRAQRDDLADVLGRANRAVGSRTALPVLQGLLCEVSGTTLRVTGTDLDMTVRTQAEVEVIEEGRAVIPGRLLSEAVRKMPAGQVTIGVSDTDIEIQGNGPRFTLRPLDVEDFPVQEEVVSEGVEVDGEELADAINQVTIAASGDGARPILTGVLFESSEEGLRMVATDSYRLAKRDLAGVGLEGTALVPARGLRELARTIGAPKVTAQLRDREAVFSSDRGTLRLRLIDGNFPKYESLLPKTYPNQVVLNKEELLDALGRVALVAEDHIPVRLKLMEGGVEVTVTRQDVGGESEHLSGEFTGSDEEVTIAFNPRYLQDGVNAMPGESVRIQVIDSYKPSVLDTGTEGNFLYLLMPVRV